MDTLSELTGVIDQVEPLVARVLAPNPSPYTYHGTQTYIIGDERSVAIIDPGPDDPLHIKAILLGISDRAVRAIMCTHTHRDHSPGATPLAQATDAKIIGCAPLTLDDDGPRADAAFDTSYRPDRILADGDTIQGDTWSVTAVATPGHTSNHLCFALDPAEALFTGDHVMGWSTTVVSPPDGDMADYMASMALLMDRDDRIYYPAHGPAIENPRKLVRSMMGHRKQREGQIVRLLEGSSLRIDDMVPSMYKGIDPRLYGAAGRSVLAHLIELERQGRVECSGETWSIIQ